MKYCKDCKHFSDAFDGSRICTMQVSSTDKWTGEKNYLICKAVREDNNKCGQDAAWFEELEEEGEVGGIFLIIVGLLGAISFVVILLMAALKILAQ